MIRVGIIGGAGYTAGELVRILVNHPDATLCFVHSESNAGRLLSDVHQGIIGDTGMAFSDSFDLNSVDVLFLCSGHGRSEAFWRERKRPDGLKVIDLAQDFRDERDGYVYGLPEWRRDCIRTADKVANPGCFATCIQLALLPLASAGLLQGDVNVTAITGSTGAGVKPSDSTHFSWRNNNISTYKVFEHQHLLEINRNLASVAAVSAAPKDAPLCSAPPQAVPPLMLPRVAQPTGIQSCTEALPEINFVPVRGDFARGIFASVYTDCPLSQEEAAALYKDFYNDVAFTFVSDLPADLKQVVNTNKCIIALEKHDNKLVISSAIDNLLKGASGQAVQNMNIMFGLDEKTGLKLKASAF